MHHTTVDEIYGETIRGCHDMNHLSVVSGIPVNEIANGLGPAISEFLKSNPDWYLTEKHTNNRLTVLAKRQI